jgi:hypothetical protein
MAQRLSGWIAAFAESNGGLSANMAAKIWQAVANITPNKWTKISKSKYSSQERQHQPGWMVLSTDWQKLIEKPDWSCNRATWIIDADDKATSSSYNSSRGLQARESRSHQRMS